MDQALMARLVALERRLAAAVPDISAEGLFKRAEERASEGRATQADLLVLFRVHRDGFESAILRNARALLSKSPDGRPHVELNNVIEVCAAIVATPPDQAVPAQWTRTLRETATTRSSVNARAQPGVSFWWGLSNMLLMTMGGVEGLYLRRKLHDELEAERSGKNRN